MLDCTIFEQFEKTALHYKNDYYIRTIDRSYTWGEVYKDVLVLSDYLYKKGFREKDRIGLYAHNSKEWLVTFFALNRIGCIIILVNYRYTFTECQNTMNICQLKTLLYEDQLLESIIDSNQFVKEGDHHLIHCHCDNTPIELIGLNSLRKINGQETNNDWYKNIKVCGEDIACIVMTSGSTGMPKGVMLSNGQLLSVSQKTCEIMHWDKSSIVCMPLPLFHSFGLSTGVLATIICGGQLALTASHHTSDILRTIDVFKCNILNGVPSLFLALIHRLKNKTYNIESLDSGIIAGSYVSKESFIAISRELNMEHLMQSYGQTETSPSISFSKYEDSIEVKAESVGYPIQDIELKLVNIETGTDCGIHELGEIWVKGFNVMKGYYKAPEKTAEVIDGLGWLKTGDIGYIDALGQLHMTGRLRELIIRCGENIAPTEIESVLLKDDNIIDAKVFGIEAPIVGEEIIACISEKQKKSDSQIVEGLRKELADYKIPKFIFHFDTLPTLSNGKIDIKQLKKKVKAKLANKA